jgi:GntR family transcriptional repressor for pyruvate dehydrogenase complex
VPVGIDFLVMGEVTARVEHALRSLLTSGELKPGDRLPSERALVRDLSASRTTIRLVLLKLTSEGLIRSEHGRAYFVCERPIH